MISSSEVQIYPTLKISPELLLPGIALDPNGTFISGQWLLGKGTILSSGEEVYHELPWSIGLVTPAVLNLHTQKLLAQCKCPYWYKTAIEKAYSHKTNSITVIRIHKRRDVEDVWFVNCLMPHHGDCVSLLLRTGCLKNSHRGSIALVPSHLVRMVPDWYAEVWEIEPSGDKNFRISVDWNEEMSLALMREFKRFRTVAIPLLFQPASPSSSDVVDFLGLQPFDLRQWRRSKPTVTFLWREERLSPPEIQMSPLISQLIRKIGLLIVVNECLKRLNLCRYRRFIIQTFKLLKREFPDCKLNVIGLGQTPQLPKWIKDYRVKNHSLNSDLSDEHIVSQSHILISAHGSHLVGLSCLPGCVVQLIPDLKWENWLDALSMRDRDRGGWSNYIGVPTCISPKSLSHIIMARLRQSSLFAVAYGSEYSGLCEPNRVIRIRNLQE
jgi:hypothetical protein